jgi:hypothetical protein
MNLPGREYLYCITDLLERSAVERNEQQLAFVLHELSSFSLGLG